MVPARSHAALAHGAVDDASIRPHGPDAARHASDILHERRSLHLSSVETGLRFGSDKEPHAKGSGESREENGSHNPILRYVTVTDDNGNEMPRFPNFREKS